MSLTYPQNCDVGDILVLCRINEIWFNYYFIWSLYKNSKQISLQIIYIMEENVQEGNRYVFFGAAAKDKKPVRRHVWRGTSGRECIEEVI